MSRINIPLVSVIMPVYNHAAFVAAAIRSVLQQTGVELELIVIDDASTDNSWEIIAAFNDPRLHRLRHEHNQGAHATLNEGLRQARGIWLAIINSDDLFHPARLQRCLEFMQTHNRQLVGSDIQLIDHSGQNINTHWWLDAFSSLKKRLLDTQDWASTLLLGNVFMTTSNMVMRREVLQCVNEFSPDRYVHDYDFLLRALIGGIRIGWLDEPLMSYRLHESNTISARPLEANRECAAMLRRHLPDLAPMLATPVLGRSRLQALGEQWARMDGYVDEIWAALQHHALVRKENELLPLIADRDQWIAERDAWIKERDHIITMQSEQLTQAETTRLQITAELHDAHTRLTAKNAELNHILHSRSYRLARLLGIPWRAARRLKHSINQDNAQRLRQRVTRLFSLPSLPDKTDLIRVTSVNALREQIDRRAPEVCCISFDVFDTLLARCIEPPESLHERICEKIAEHLGHPHSAASVLQSRKAVEHELRQACVDNGGDYECHFQALLARWVERLSGQENPALLAWIEAQELTLEKQALAAKPGMAQLLTHVREQGLRIIAVSDMYLGESHIQELLQHCGLGALIDRLYVSAEYGLGKYSTRLHQHVLNNEGLEAHQVIHVGDNIHSDMLAPLQLGMQGIFLDEKTERTRRRHQSLSAQMVRNAGAECSVWHGRRFFEIVAQHQRLKPEQTAAHPTTNEQSFFFEYGRDVLGPAFCGFTLGLVERLRAWQPDKVFFLARDGYLFQKLYQQWQTLDTSSEPLPEAVYTYASRRVVASAAIAEGMSHAQAIVGLYNPKQQGLLSILKTYGLPLDDFREHAAEHGFSAMDAPLHDWHDPRLLAFLEDARVQSHIRSFGQQARAHLENYLEQLGFFRCERAALVDIGWNGTIQKFLGQAFALREDLPDIRGYYFAFVGKMHDTSAQSDTIEGLLTDARHNNPCENIPGEFEELFEQGARALEATTLGYRRMDDGTIIPILKADDSPDRQEERLCNPMIAAMHQGALAHLPHFHAAQQLTGYRFAQLKPYLQALLERAVVYPTQEEIHHISQLAHTEDFGHDHVLDIGNRDLGWWSILRHPRRFLYELRIAPWRYAMLARLPTKFPIRLYRYLFIRKKA
jgi:predicted HAD superfamily hydrolase/glycosyltransferase involved in cell wall biosynthesis